MWEGVGGGVGFQYSYSSESDDLIRNAGDGKRCAEFEWLLHPLHSLLFIGSLLIKKSQCMDTKKVNQVAVVHYFSLLLGVYIEVRTECVLRYPEHNADMFNKHTYLNLNTLVYLSILNPNLLLIN